MLKNILLLSSFLLLQFTSVAQTIDQTKSMVYFKIGNMGFSSVKGTFSGFTGKVNFNPNQLSSSKIDVCIDAASIDTRNKKRDDHLRSKDFFEVETYPKICFTSERISAAEGDAQAYTAHGKLKMHGITKHVEIPLTLKDNKLTGFITVNRFDYNVGEDIGTFMAGTEVEIMIHCFLKPKN